jgi:hypothetical protein
MIKGRGKTGKYEKCMYDRKKLNKNKQLWNLK